MTATLGQKTLSQQVFILREHVFVMQEELTGGRILPQALRLGGCRREFAMGDEQKTRRFLENWKTFWKQWLDLVTDDPLLESRLKNLLAIPSGMIESLGWWGIVGKASSVCYDSRKHRPHGAYPHLNFTIPRRDRGDAGSRFEVVIEEVELTLSLLDQLLQTIPKSDGSIKAGPASGSQGPELKPGFYFGCSESAKGPVIAAVEINNDGHVTTLRLFATGQRVWPCIDPLFHSIRAEDFQVAFTSLGVDSEEAEI
jgi:Ni,Fe-hydrogenase III large subunit